MLGYLRDIFKPVPSPSSAVTSSSLKSSSLVNDHQIAHVYVKSLLGSNEAIVLKALRTHTAFFQKTVAGKLKLRFAAKIKFMPDESFDVAMKIDTLLADPRVVRDLGAED